MLVSTNALDDQVRRTLVETLYTQPGNLAAGALLGISTGWIAAYVSGSRVLAIAAALLTIVAVSRVLMALLLPRNPSSNAFALEFLYEIGAFGYALSLGSIAALTVWLDVDTSVQLLMVSNALAYGTGIAARNAGRPVISIGQTIFATVPVCAVLLLFGNMAERTLAVAILLGIPTMMSITLNVFHVLRNSIASAETNARLAEKMRVLARTDVVTGLLNRAGLNQDLGEIVARLAKNERMALFWMDLDKFKEVNDTLGHQVGDSLLAEIASRLRQLSPEGSVVARFGGDEFVIACKVKDRRAVEALALSIMSEITRPIRVNDNRLEIASSIGISTYPDDGRDVETLMQGADLALYHAKVNGRKQVSYFEPAMTRELVRRREIENELRVAIQREELSIFFQPIVDLETGRIRAFEALVRWFHPEKGELRPDEFIAVAEECGAIITLGNWITLQACKAAAQWPEDITIAVNVSPLQIKAPGAKLGILNALREAKLDPKRLELEITETVLLDHSQNAEGFINDLSAVGIRFALDDFGTGYSSLGYLNRYPISKIKVDRSFVSGINAGQTSQAIIRAVSGMGATLGMEIVAEGLESMEQVLAVKAAGCTLGQGYHFSRAVPDYLAALLIAKEREAEIPAMAAVG